MPESEDLVPAADLPANVSPYRLYGWVEKAPVSLEDFVPPYIASRFAGVRSTTVHLWLNEGRVATQPGRHGPLVRVTDVLAYAAQQRVGGATAGGQEGDGGHDH